MKISDFFAALGKEHTRSYNRGAPGDPPQDRIAQKNFKITSNKEWLL